MPHPRVTDSARRMGRRRTILGALFPVAIMTVLAACSSTVAGSAVPTGAASTSPTAIPHGSVPASSAPVPAGLGRFYSQQLDWGSCADLATSDETTFYRSPAVRCTDLTVPLAYDDPAGETISLKVLRKPATDQAARVGAVVMNPGGPGGSAVEFTGSYAAVGIGAELNASMDLVGFDPRGVGFSAPLIVCQTDAERDASRAVDARTRTQQEIDAANAVARSFADGCARLSGADHDLDGVQFLANVGTRDVARDLDILRAALGEAQLNYLGYSYGTQIGWVYAEQFPRNVRAMILDGAVDPQADPAAERLGEAEGFQRAFDDFASWCAQRNACVLGDDQSKATAVYKSLVRPLLDRPLPVSDGRVISFGDATIGTMQALYVASLRETLAAALLGLSEGNGDKLMALADTYDGRDASGHYANKLDALLAVNCVDGSGSIDPAANDQLTAKYFAAAPFLDSGDPPVGLKSACDYWPVKPTLTPHLPKVAGLPRILVISTTQDPATPYESGVKLADALGASLLTVEGTNHTAYLGVGNSCVDSIGTAYLTTLALPADGTRC